MSLRNHLIGLQKKSFLSLKQEVIDLRRFESFEISSYRQSYLNEVKTYKNISSKEALFQAIADADIVFCGDFHTLARSQYTAKKILEFLFSQKKNVTFALEMIPRDKEKIADDYIQGHISEEIFLDLLHYQKIWGFPWEHYRPIFELAQKHKSQILGINTSQGGYLPLDKRDQFAAKAIAHAWIKNNNQVIFCQYGDFHMARQHIPNACRKILKELGAAPAKMLTVFQNSDDIYWSLVNDSPSLQADVVQISSEAFCVLNTTPWIKWQSYQTWMDDHMSLLEPTSEESWEIHHAPDYFHKIVMLSQNIKNFLKFAGDTRDQLKVYSSDDLESYEAVNTSVLKARAVLKDPALQNILDREMIENRTLFLPDIPLIYLQDISINRMAQKASQWVAYCMCKNFKVLDQSFSSHEIFSRLCMIECIGFFGSKIINPKQKVAYLKDFKVFLARIQNEALSKNEVVRQHVARNVLKIFDDVGSGVSREGRQERLNDLIPDLGQDQLFFLVSQSVGKVLGDYLYRLVLQEKININQLKKLYRCFDSKNTCFMVLDALICRVQNDDVWKYSKDDFF